MHPLISALFPKDKYVVRVMHCNEDLCQDPDIKAMFGIQGKRKYLTVCTVADKQGNVIAEGIAQCSMHDQPVRKKGFQLAVKRAYNDLKNVLSNQPSSLADLI